MLWNIEIFLGIVCEFILLDFKFTGEMIIEDHNVHKLIRNDFRKQIWGSDVYGQVEENH